MSDPFTIAGESIKAAILARPAVLVTLGFDVTKTTLEKLADSTVYLEQGSFELSPTGSNSMVVSGTQDYEIRITTGVELTNEVMNKLKWETFVALLAAGPTLGLNFVRVWTLLPGQDEPDEPQRFKQQWQTAFVVRVEMYWNRQNAGAQYA